MGKWSQWSSIFGPIMFLLYINDLPACISNLFKLYADGSKILALVHDSVEQDFLAGLRKKEQVQNDLNNTTEWTIVSKIKWKKKCKVVHFGAKDTTHTGEYTIEDIDSGERSILEESKCEKDLGVYICIQ